MTIGVQVNIRRSKARKPLAARLSSMPSDTAIAASDIMNGATFGRVRDGWVHDAKGYWDLAGQHLAAEAFADFLQPASQRIKHGVLHLSGSPTLVQYSKRC